MSLMHVYVQPILMLMAHTWCACSPLIVHVQAPGARVWGWREEMCVRPNAGVHAFSRPKGHWDKRLMRLPR